MAGKYMIKASEIAEELDISKALAYKMIRQWNKQLEEKGYTTVQGRVTRKYFEEQIYGMTESKKEGA